MIEDAAECFDDSSYTGHPLADAVLFSFGLIKTTTCLGGGVVIVKDGDLHSRMARIHRSYPLTSEGVFLRRSWMGSILHPLGYPRVFGMFEWVCRSVGVSVEHTLTSYVRGFIRGKGLLPQIRKQPTQPILSLMVISPYMLNTTSTLRLTGCSTCVQ